MLTLITGVPGSFKSCYAVWELARSVPGSTIEAQERVTVAGKVYEKGEPVPRRLVSNVKGLLVDHTVIDDEDLLSWPEWAQPGDVILFDEVQSAWRARSFTKDVPESVRELETHRHRGIDFIVVTQHPNLLDANVRRFVGRHLHLRRIAKLFTVVYEWDHCGTPGSYKTTLSHKLWRAKKEAFGLYKSAQLHTKPATRFPIAFVVLGLAAAGAAAFTGQEVFTRVVKTGKPEPAAVAPTGAASGPVDLRARWESAKPVLAPSAPASAPAAPVDPTAGFGGGVSQRPLGCVAFAGRCECFDAEGLRLELPSEVCREGSHRTGYVLPHRGGAPGARPAASDAKHAKLNSGEGYPNLLPKPPESVGAPMPRGTMPEAMPVRGAAGGVPEKVTAP